MRNFATALLVLFTLFTSSLVAQIAFKPASFLDNNGNKTDCLIKDLDWKANPVSFEYKITENDLVQIGKIENVQEFQVGEFTKYIRKDVDIDRWDKYMPPSIQKQPIYKNETLFLKVLVEGSATLYEYTSVSFSTYFYVIDSKEPQQLIQKQYVVNNVGRDMVYKNDLYKAQLQSALGGDIIKQSDTKNLSYFRNDFVKLFEKFNQSKGESTVMVSSNSFKVHLTPRIGANFNSVDVRYLPSSSYDYDFGVKTNLRVGVELEAVLPFNRGKWAIALEPAFTTYKAEGDGSVWTSNVDYQALEIHIVARHYMFLNDKSKVFLNAGFVYSTDINDSYYGPLARPTAVEIDLNPTFVLGAGYKYKKISAEFRYLGSQNMVRNQSTWEAHYKAYAVILGYEIF